MLTIHSAADLCPLGINPLTGEADPLSQRILCDLSEAGRALVITYLGLPGDTSFCANWNSRVGDAPAVASMMLPRSLLGSREFWIFATLASGYDYAVDLPGQVTAMHKKDNHCSVYMKAIQDGRVPGQLHERPPAFRNVHAFTGRLV